MYKNSKKYLKRIFSVILFITTAFITIASPFFKGEAFSVYANTEHTAYEYYEKGSHAISTENLKAMCSDLIEWKKSTVGRGMGENLFTGDYLDSCGTTAGDWYVIAMGRLGISDDYSTYLAKLKNIIEIKYEEDGTLSNVKATEYHRMTLAALSAGGDPIDMGTDSDGNNIDLIKDGVYDRGYTADIGKQGINGTIWGLIAIDTFGYEVPKDSYYTREDIIKKIISLQLDTGGFALTGNNMDVDITAMAVQALATYYEDDTVYSYHNTKTDTEENKTVKEIVDLALGALAEKQQEDGDFVSFGYANVESTAQVVIALCSLNINPLEDERFIKNGNTLLDGILKYRMADGGFAHCYGNPDYEEVSNSMSGEQTLLAFCAMIRQQEGMNRLYDFSEEEKSIWEDDIKSNDFNDKDRELILKHKEEKTVKYKNDVIRLIDLLEEYREYGTDVLSEKEVNDYLSMLYEMRINYESAQSEIESINSEVLKRLYPFEKLTLGDKKSVDSLVERANSLSEYDRDYIAYYEDLIRGKTQLDNELRGYIIAVIIAVVVILLGVTVVLNIKKRRVRKKSEEDYYEGE